jgi:hypothetical protein
MIDQNEELAKSVSDESLVPSTRQTVSSSDLSFGGMASRSVCRMELSDRHHHSELTKL